MSKLKVFEVEEVLEKEINDYIKKKGYSSFSEFVRDSIRKNLRDDNGK
jgi:metal-responsive CopG/Arc/MetJ family transcriptional regulator